MGRTQEAIENRLLAGVDRVAGWAARHGRNAIIRGSLAVVIASGSVAAVEGVNAINNQIINPDHQLTAEQFKQEQSNENMILLGSFIVAATAGYLALNAELGRRGYLFWFRSPMPIGRVNPDQSIDLYQEGIRLPTPEQDAKNGNDTDNGNVIFLDDRRK